MIALDDLLPADPLARLRVLGEAIDLHATGVQEHDLVLLAAWALGHATLGRVMLRAQITDATAELQSEVIALAARGLVAPARLEGLGEDAFASSPRLFAWTCALGACRRFGRDATFADARRLLGTCDAFEAGARFELPRAMAVELFAETLEELDAAEDIERPSVEAIGRLLAHQRAQRARAWLAPVLEAMDRGVPAIDSAARLREAANIFEGRT